MSEKLAHSAPADVVLKADNLRYLNKGLKHHLSLEVRAGETIAILGASGTGKTTLLNTLAGLSPADGMLILGGYYLNDLAPKVATRLRQKHFTFLKANPPAPLARKVKNAITEMATAHYQHTPSYFPQIIADLELEPFLNQPLTELTDSDKQTVALAGALGKKAKILFADNPTRRMTPEATARAMQTLHKIANQQRLTVVYSTSDPALAALADRVLVIRNGEIIVELAGPQNATELETFTSYLAELTYPPVFAAQAAGASTFDSDQLDAATQEAPAETGQFPIILPLPNRPAEPDLEALPDGETPAPEAENGAAGLPDQAWRPDQAWLPDQAGAPANAVEDTHEITLVHPPTEPGDEEIDLAVLGEPATHTKETPAPLPGESLEETLQRLAPTRSFDPDSAHLLDEAQRILKSLPGSVAPNPVWLAKQGDEDA